jgi:ribonuclease P protein component
VKEKSLTDAKIQFSLVYAKGKSWAARELVIRALPNKLNSSRFGFVVSRRVGNAVVRNYIKRILREITRQTPVKPGWDIVFIARIPVAAVGFEDLGKSVRELLFRADLGAGGHEINSPGND